MSESLEIIIVDRLEMEAPKIYGQPSRRERFDHLLDRDMRGREAYI